MSPPISVKGVLLLDGKVVLLRNDREEWELPGGRVENGEDHAQTLVREFTEELAITIRVGPRIDSYLFEVIPGRHVFIVTYGCNLVGEFEPNVSDEHKEHCLCPIDRLFELPLPAGYRNSIETWARTA